MTDATSPQRKTDQVGFRVAAQREIFENSLCVKLLVKREAANVRDGRAAERVAALALLSILRRRCSKNYCALDVECHRAASQVGPTSRPRHPCDNSC